MGFIKDNTNTFEVYLTDLGKQKFFDGGFKDSIAFFSLCDMDSNYQLFDPQQNQISEFSANPICSNYYMIISTGEEGGLPNDSGLAFIADSSWGFATQIKVNPVDYDGTDMSDFWENLPVGSTITVGDFPYETTAIPTLTGSFYTISVSYSGTVQPDPFLPGVMMWCIESNISGNFNTYNVGDVVKYNNNFYRKVVAHDYECGCEYLPSNSVYWDRAIIFDPVNISPQPIPTINHVGTYKTSLANGVADDDDFVNDVFVQIPLRGNSVDNMIYRRALFGTKHDTQRSYVLYEPDFNSNQTLTVLSYIIIDE